MSFEIKKTQCLVWFVHFTICSKGDLRWPSVKDVEEEERLLEEGTHVTIAVVVENAHVQHVNLITEQEIPSAKDVEEEERLLEEGTHVTIAVVVENAHVQHVFPTHDNATYCLYYHN